MRSSYGERGDLAHAASVLGAGGEDRPLEQDLGGRRVRAAVADELDGEMQVGLARREPLGEGKRIAGLDQHVQPPALDLRAFAVSVSISISVISLTAS